MLPALRAPWIPQGPECGWLTPRGPLCLPLKARAAVGMCALKMARESSWFVAALGLCLLLGAARGSGAFGGSYDGDIESGLWPSTLEEETEMTQVEREGEAMRDDREALHGSFVFGPYSPEVTKAATVKGWRRENFVLAALSVCAISLFIVTCLSLRYKRLSVPSPPSGVTEGGLSVRPRGCWLLPGLLLAGILLSRTPDSHGPSH